VITLERLNALATEEFAATLAGIFEHSPWVAQRAAAGRPFAARLRLLDSMRAAVDNATSAEQLALIRAHPELGVRGRAASPLTLASAAEQRRAGLASCTPAHAARLQQLNARYRERFGFPFILAVRGHDPASIIANFERRLESDAESERRSALNQIGTIAAYRLADMVASPPGPEIVAMLEQLARPAASTGATTEADAGTVREWMQAAGLEVWPAPDSAPLARHLVGCTRGESSAKTLLTGVYHDALLKSARYRGCAAGMVAIEVAQQLRHRGVRPPFDLAVLSFTDDAAVDGSGGLVDSDAPHVWVELGAADVAGGADARAAEITRALRTAGLGQAVTLVRQAAAAGVHGAAGALTAAAAGQAAHALEQALRCVQTAA
jgi:OHCU decarboxylase